MKTTSLALMALIFSTSALASPVNINKASAQEIARALSGIGPKKAQAIVAYRDRNGRFSKGADIVSVKGIGASTFQRNRQDIRLK